MPMRFRITGAERDAGNEVVLEMAAADSIQAEANANRMGILVASIEQLADRNSVTWEGWRRGAPLLILAAVVVVAILWKSQQSSKSERGGNNDSTQSSSPTAKASSPTLVNVVPVTGEDGFTMTDGTPAEVQHAILWRGHRVLFCMVYNKKQAQREYFVVTNMQMLDPRDIDKDASSENLALYVQVYGWWGKGVWLDER
jgi:hypothetical protein